VYYDAGYGKMYETVEADNAELALDSAEELWREAAESNADYDVIGEFTDELAEEYGVE
jgi:hypothetical protein